MDIKIQYRYYRDEIPPRCRKPRSVEYIGEMTVTVREVGALDAPVAILQESATRGEDDNHIAAMYRWYDGVLWLPKLARYARPNRDVQMTLLPRYELAEASDVYAYDSARYYDHANPYGIGSRFHGRAQSEETERIEASFAPLLLIDGVLHQKATEPVYRITTFGLGHNHGGTAIFAEGRFEYFDADNQPNNYFSLLQRAEAVDEATATALKRGDTASIPFDGNIHYDCTVLIPEAIRTRPKPVTSVLV